SDPLSSILCLRSSSCYSFLRGSSLLPLTKRRTEKFVQLISEQNSVISERELSRKAQVLGESFEVESGDAPREEQQQGEYRIPPGVEPLTDFAEKVDRITFKKKADRARHVVALALLLVNDAVNRQIDDPPAAFVGAVVHISVLDVEEDVLVEKPDLAQAGRADQQADAVERFGFGHLAAREVAGAWLEPVAEEVDDVAPQPRLIKDRILNHPSFAQEGARPRDANVRMRFGIGDHLLDEAGVGEHSVRVEDQHVGGALREGIFDAAVVAPCVTQVAARLDGGHLRELFAQHLLGAVFRAVVHHYHLAPRIGQSAQRLQTSPGDLAAVVR